MNKKPEYHPGAKYIDCCREGRDYCRFCGWCDESHNKKTKKEIFHELKVINKTK